MPIIKLQGGLGNQMFEYALAYALSGGKTDDIEFDGYLLENRFFKANWTFRTFELNVFGIEPDYVLPGNFEKKYIHPSLKKLCKKIKYGKQYVEEIGGKCIDRFPEDPYLDGWFQSYKYFDAFSDDIKRIFTVQTPIDGENKNILESLKHLGNTTVSIHVRRGDYVSLESANKWHGVCSIGYYEEAIRLMMEQIEHPVFLVFSDDIAWCKENILFPAGVECIYVDHNEGKGHEDLRLMYSCSHHIIANSSFSWWGAYLGRNPDKTIIAPKKWLQTDTFSMTHLIPPTWKLL